jgi:hypothetical protein
VVTIYTTHCTIRKLCAPPTPCSTCSVRLSQWTATSSWSALTAWSMWRTLLVYCEVPTELFRDKLQTSNINHPASLSSPAITHSTQYYKISHKWYCRFLHTEHFCAVYSPVTLPWAARIDWAINSLGSLSVCHYPNSCLRATEIECVCVALRNCEKRLLAACLSVRTKHLGSHWMDFHEIWYKDFRKSVEKIQVSLK